MMAVQQDKQIVEEVRALKIFRVHLSIYLIVNACLWLIWLIGGGMSIYAWPIYPGLIWGVALLLHYWVTYRAFRKRKRS